MVFLVFLSFVLSNRTKKQIDETEGYAGRKRNVTLLFENQYLKKRLLSG